MRWVTAEQAVRLMARGWTLGEEDGDYILLGPRGEARLSPSSFDRLHRNGFIRTSVKPGVWVLTHLGREKYQSENDR